jgi:transposase
VIVLEDLTGITIGTKQKGKMSKKGRKLVAHWNKRLLTQRIKDNCEENRVLLAFVPPYDTSRACSECGNVSQDSRKGELYECIKCGHTIDADYQGSLNIKSLYKDG